MNLPGFVINCSKTLFVPNCEAVIGAKLAAFMNKPLYKWSGFLGIGLPSCKAFFMPTMGWQMQTSVTPPTAPMNVCSRDVTFDILFKMNAKPNAAIKLLNYAPRQGLLTRDRK